jgi:hypothetical protein
MRQHSPILLETRATGCPCGAGPRRVTIRRPFAAGVPRVGVSRRKRAIRRTAGWARLAAWICTLHLVHSPWEDLGGIVNETIRWTERFVLGSATILGWTLGGTALDPTAWPRRLPAPRLRRWMLYPMGAAAAVALPVLTLLEQTEIAGVVFNGVVGYVAGFDLAFDAWPLMWGNEGGRSPAPIVERADRFAMLTGRSGLDGPAVLAGLPYLDGSDESVYLNDPDDLVDLDELVDPDEPADPDAPPDLDESADPDKPADLDEPADPDTPVDLDDLDEWVGPRD